MKQDQSALCAFCGGGTRESLILTSLVQPGPVQPVTAESLNVSVSPPFHLGRPVEKSGWEILMSSTLTQQDNGGPSGGHDLVPMCLCPVDGAVDGVALPACAAPASQHAD